MSSNDITDLKNIPISEILFRLNIRKNGSKYYCPFHKDDTPSLSIKDNFFNCFGCGIGGDGIKFYELYYKIDFNSAIKELSELFGIPINARSSGPTSSTIKKDKTTYKEYKFNCEYDLYLFDERAGLRYRYNEIEGLYNQDEAEFLAMDYVRTERLNRNIIIFNDFYNFCKANADKRIDDLMYNYLINVRKLSEEVVKDHKIFSLCNYREVSGYLKSRYDIEELKGTGLFNEKNNLIFTDSHRLLIPYLQDGKIIYLRSRYFDCRGDTKTNSVKYFGLKNDNTNLNTVKRFYNTDILSDVKIYDDLFICEGEIDCLSLLTLKIPAVAIPGISSIPDIEDIKKLLDFQVTLAFDNDKAGNKATENFIKLFNSFNKTVFSVNELLESKKIKDLSDYLIHLYKRNQEI